MSDFLTTMELAELVGCRPNQRNEMIKWLDRERWRYVTDRNGLPKVARAFFNRKLGIEETNGGAKYEDAPNLAAFA